MLNRSVTDCRHCRGGWQRQYARQQPGLPGSVGLVTL